MAATIKSMRNRVLRQQLEITARMLDAVERALSHEDQLFRYVEIVKSKDDGGIAEHTGGAINEKRLFDITRAIEIIFEMQRLALDIPAFKERADAEIARAKLRIEREKLGQKNPAPAADDGFLAAITAALG